MNGRFGPVFIFVWYLYLLTNGIDMNSQVTVSSWQRVKIVETMISGYEVWVRGRSKVECIRECNKYSHCTSFVFNVSSRTCYLQPTQVYTSNTVHLGQVYVNKDPKCDTRKAPLINGTAKWQRTLTSCVGKVKCSDDFIKTTDDVVLRCDADGTWDKEGSCVQHAWNDMPLTAFPVQIPLPVIDGWSLCLEGIPTADERFTVELMTAAQSQPLHADFRFRWQNFSNVIYLGHKLDGNYVGGQSFSDFPFVVGQPFHLRIKAIENATFEIYVEDVLTATYAQHQRLPASDVSIVNVRNDVTVTRLDLWCNL